MGRLGTKVILPYIHRFKDCRGSLRHYYRRGGKHLPLRGDPGSAEFMKDYAAAAAQFASPTERAIRPTAPEGSIARLVLAYMASTKFRKLKPSSQAVQRRIYERLVDEVGQRSVKGFTRDKIDTMVAKMADRPGAANSFLKRMKTLMVYAVLNRWIDIDPTYRMESFDEGEHHTWNEDEIATFEAHWPIGSKQRLAFALHLFTGQRRSDIYRMTWAHLDDGGIWVRQLKTGTLLWVPIHDELEPILAGRERATETILATDYGKPFSVAGYGQWINGAIRTAGLPERCVAHGLRKAAARRLAEAGCSAKQIASITGHKTLAEVERYTQAADQKHMAKAAMALQKAASAGKHRVAELANNAIIVDKSNA